MTQATGRPKVIWLLTLLLLVAAAACGGRAPDGETISTVPTGSQAPIPTASAVPSSTPATAIEQPPAPTATLTPTQSPTPRPVVVAVPAEWREAVDAGLAPPASEPGPEYAWSISTEADPAAALADGRAQMALVHGDHGLVVRREPIALAVPFTTNWEAVSQAEADAILSNGDSLARAIPWGEMDPANKALRVDGRHPTDADYPYQDSWSLLAAPGFEEPAADLALQLAGSLAPLPAIRLAAVGDINLDRSPAYIITTTGDLAYPLSLVKPVLEAADFAMGNLETALGDIGEPAAKVYPFRSPPVAAQSLALGGLDLVSLANNHAMDYGPQALLQGIGLLRDAGVATVGAGENLAAAHAAHVVDIDGLTVGVLGYVNVPVEGSTHFDTRSWTAANDSPGLAWGDPETIRADVAALNESVDLTVVLLHSGYEYIEEPSEEQVAAARAAVDAGADLVIGHHAHILQGVHRYGEGVIVYGMGNFLFDIDGPRETAILNVWLDQNGVRQLELVPAIIQEHGQPRLAEAWEAAPILSRVYYLTTILNAANPD